MKTRLILIVTLLSAAIIFTQCGKKGCTDKDSKDYCDKCKKDDGSCTYEGSAVFWYGKTTADSLYESGSNTLSFYVDNVLIGSSSVTVYSASSPSCEGGQAHVKKDLGKSKTKSYSYTIKDDLGDIIWEGTGTYTANGCDATELIW